MFSGYRNLGTVEVIDQINVTKYVVNQVPNIHFVLILLQLGVSKFTDVNF